MQAERLFKTIFLLMERSPRTTRELAENAEVSTRTIRRDVESLSSAGIPVYMTRGKGGGVHLLEGYVLDKALVSEKDQSDILAALATLRSIGASEDDGIDGRIARLFQREAADWLDVDFSFWGAPPEYRRVFDLIRTSIIERRVLGFTYRDATGAASRRTVEPEKLLFKESCWYLRAWCLTRRADRTFKLARIEWPSLEILPGTFAPRLPDRGIPPIEERAQERRMIRFRVLPTGEALVRDEFPPETIKRLDDGSLLVSLACQPTEHLKRRLLSFGRLIKIEAPPEIRDWVRDQAQGILDS